MPYIKQERRTIYAQGAYPVQEVAGDLNYQLTVVIRHYLETKGTNYSTINDIIGALEGAKLEFYRRVAAPYEEEAIKRNGDLY